MDRSKKIESLLRNRNPLAFGDDEFRARRIRGIAHHEAAHILVGTLQSRTSPYWSMHWAPDWHNGQAAACVRWDGQALTPLAALRTALAGPVANVLFDAMEDYEDEDYVDEDYIKSLVLERVPELLEESGMSRGSDEFQVVAFANLIDGEDARCLGMQIVHVSDIDAAVERVASLVGARDHWLRGEVLHVLGLLKEHEETWGTLAEDSLKASTTDEVIHGAGLLHTDDEIEQLEGDDDGWDLLQEAFRAWGLPPLPKRDQIPRLVVKPDGTTTTVYPNGTTDS